MSHKNAPSQTGFERFRIIPEDANGHEIGNVSCSQCFNWWPRQCAECDGLAHCHAHEDVWERLTLYFCCDDCGHRWEKVSK